jgi:thymidylate synthase (FAD)
MKIVKPRVEFFGAVPTDYENALKFIEMAGRTCYKSEDKISSTSAESFVKRLIKAGHLAMVEHSNFVVRKQVGAPDDTISALVTRAGKFLTVRADHDFFYIGGNLTAWFQQDKKYGWKDYIFAPFYNAYSGLFWASKEAAVYTAGWHPCSHSEIPKELHRYSAKFICDRGVSHELVRHRPCSFAQESTRYVNYAGKEMEFIEPAGYAEWSWDARRYFRELCEFAEIYYRRLTLGEELKPQQARAVLPNALKTEIVVTADAKEWAHIRKLRTSPAAHPDMVRLMGLVPWEEFL